MKYFVKESERKGTCYHEFQKGRWDGETFWRKDSLLMHDDVFCDLKLATDLFMKIIPNYDSYGPTEVSQEQWRAVCDLARALGGAMEAAIRGVQIWVEDNFQVEEVFTILGI